MTSFDMPFIATWDLHDDETDEAMERDIIHDQHLERARMLARQAEQAERTRLCREWLEQQTERQEP